MFVIACKFVQNISHIVECVEAISKFHPNEKICVVDSYSDDTSYFEQINKYNNVIVSKYKNKHYECGALYYAYKEFPDETHYILLQDSIILKHNWDEFINNNTTYNLMWFKELGPFGSPEYIHISKVLAETEYTQHINNGHYGIYGMLGVYKRDIMEIFNKKGLLKAALPNDKFGAQMTERIFGICLMRERHDITKNTIEGDFLSKVNAVPNDELKYFRKYYGGRQ